MKSQLYKGWWKYKLFWVDGKVDGKTNYHQCLSFLHRIDFFLLISMILFLWSWQWIPTHPHTPPQVDMLDMMDHCEQYCKKAQIYPICYLFDWKIQPISLLLGCFYACILVAKMVSNSALRQRMHILSNFLHACNVTLNDMAYLIYKKSCIIKISDNKRHPFNKLSHVVFFSLVRLSFYLPSLSLSLSLSLFFLSALLQSSKLKKMVVAKATKWVQSECVGSFTEHTTHTRRSDHRWTQVWGILGLLTICQTHTIQLSDTCNILDVKSGEHDRLPWLPCVFTIFR